MAGRPTCAMPSIATSATASAAFVPKDRLVDRRRDRDDSRRWRAGDSRASRVSRALASGSRRSSVMGSTASRCVIRATIAEDIARLLALVEHFWSHPERWLRLARIGRRGPDLGHDARTAGMARAAGCGGRRACVTAAAETMRPTSPNDIALDAAGRSSRRGSVELRGRVALVTGAGRRVGRALAVGLGAPGHEGRRALPRQRRPARRNGATDSRRRAAHRGSCRRT